MQKKLVKKTEWFFDEINKNNIKQSEIIAEAAGSKLDVTKHLHSEYKWIDIAVDNIKNSFTAKMASISKAMFLEALGNKTSIQECLSNYPKETFALLGLLENDLADDVDDVISNIDDEKTKSFLSFIGNKITSTTLWKKVEKFSELLLSVIKKLFKLRMDISDKIEMLVIKEINTTFKSASEQIQKIFKIEHEPPPIIASGILIAQSAFYYIDKSMPNQALTTSAVNWEKWAYAGVSALMKLVLTGFPTIFIIEKVYKLGKTFIVAGLALKTLIADMKIHVKEKN